MEDFTSSVTTRMRRAFKYPEDSEIEHETREELDEEGENSRSSWDRESQKQHISAILRLRLC